MTRVWVMVTGQQIRRKPDGVKEILVGYMKRFLTAGVVCAKNSRQRRKSRA